MKRLFILALAILLMEGCGMNTPELLDGAVAYDSPVQVSYCDPSMTHWDFSNCGECGHECDATNSDQCFNSECRCGLSTACEDGADCRFGMCVLPDMIGDNHCEFDEECNVNSACIEGFCTFIRCVPEVCDGLDNDCDGVVDGTVSGPLAEWCYSGPESDPTRINAPCGPGIRICVGSEWTECQGEIAPIPEIGLLACDGRDNDCDTCPDGDYVDGACAPLVVGGFDIVFIFDTSPSMVLYSRAVVQAMQRFATTFDRPDFRYALLLLPGEINTVTEMSLNFTDYTTFIARAATLTDIRGGSGEPSLDAVYEIGTNEIGLDFNEENIRIIFLFTDEYGQSYRLPRIDEEAMCDTLTHGEMFVMFNHPTFYGDFDMCLDRFHELDTTRMAETLEAIIQDPCLEE